MACAVFVGRKLPHYIVDPMIRQKLHNHMGARHGESVISEADDENKESGP